jgi:YtkA-like
MVTHRLLEALAIALMAVAPAACVSSGGGTGGSSTVATSLCDTDPRVQSYAVGLSQTGTEGLLKVSFVDATPAPPALNENAWTVKITDETGAPVTGATITLKPFMPDMGHGASVTPQIMPTATAGVYQITTIDLFMAGIWTNTFTIKTASGQVATAVFTFCIDG